MEAARIVELQEELTHVKEKIKFIETINKLITARIYTVTRRNHQLVVANRCMFAAIILLIIVVCCLVFV